MSNTREQTKTSKSIGKKTSSSKTSSSSSRSKKNNLPSPLKVSDVFKECKTSEFKIKKFTSKFNDIIGQSRASKAINMGLSIRKPGYNIYIAGHQGTGKNSVLRSFLEKWSKKFPTPNDWVYVYDFETPKTANAISLPPGEGSVLKKKLDSFIKAVKKEITQTLQSEYYKNKVNSYLSLCEDRKTKLFSELDKLAKSLDFEIKSTQIGIETVPIIDGKPISEEEYDNLSEREKQKIESKRTKLEPDILDFARKVRNIDLETKEYTEGLRTFLGEKLIDRNLSPIITEYQDKNTSSQFDEVLVHLEKLRTHVLENILDIMEQETFTPEESPVKFMQPQTEENIFDKYEVNVFLDNSKVKGAPVIFDSNPTFYNLFGKVDKNMENGVYQADFRMIKPGSIHKANGGYLVLNVADILKTTTTIWDTLKRVIRNRSAFIEDMGEQYSMLPTSSLKPDPIPLDLKVILIGSDDLYHVLFDEDEDFQKLFKIKADFDYKMERNSKNLKSYVDFISSRALVENTTPIDPSAVAKLIEYSSRLVEDQRYLSTQFGLIKDLIIESDYYAKEDGSKSIKAKHVNQALTEKVYRANLYEDHLNEMLKNGDIFIDVNGQRVGQINGLTVYDLGDHAFGKACRITCTTSVSDDGIINIERSARLSGRTHDKGICIISGFLTSVLARKESLGISASICFEQSYGPVDGDSASTAELIAVLSSLSKIPIRQNFAVTGSINQLGDIQPVGGVNEKIEGFCKLINMVGKRDNYGLILPRQNVENLMLNDETQATIKSGRLSIYPVTHIWEAFELITGVELGIKNVEEENFSERSCLDIINKKLASLQEEEEDSKSKSKSKSREK